MFKIKPTAPKFEIKYGKSGDVRWLEVVGFWVFDGKNEVAVCERSYDLKADINKMKLDVLRLMIKNIDEFNNSNNKTNS